MLRCFLLLALMINVGTVFAQVTQPAAKVIVQTLTFESIATTLEAVGTAEAIQSVDIYPAVADKVVAMYFTPGDIVEKNTVLLELDSRKQRVALQRAQIELDNATKNYVRLSRSNTNGAVTQSALDDAKTFESLAKVSVLEAQIELDDRKVIAPFSGVVGLTNIEVGDRINLNTLITTIDKQNQLFINFNAPETSRQALLDNSRKVTLQPWSNRELVLNAEISQIDSRVNEQSRSIRVRALLDNQESAYLPGMSFRVNLLVKGKRFAAVPESSLSWGPNDAYVWKVVDNKAQKVTVNIKQRLRGRLLVEGQLEASDAIIVEGIQRLRAGQTVEVIETRGML